mgnify:CR=1 FL=1
MMNNVETLYCTNPECPAKFMKAFTLFVSRDAMNIDACRRQRSKNSWATLHP